MRRQIIKTVILIIFWYIFHSKHKFLNHKFFCIFFYYFLSFLYYIFLFIIPSISLFKNFSLLYFNNWWSLINTKNKNISESLQSRSLDFRMLWEKLKFKKRVDYTYLIIRLHAFSRLRPVSSLLGLISQSQQKNLHLIHEWNIVFFEFIYENKN